MAALLLLAGRNDGLVASLRYCHVFSRGQADICTVGRTDGYTAAATSFVPSVSLVTGCGDSATWFVAKDDCRFVLSVNVRFVVHFNSTFVMSMTL